MFVTMLFVPTMSILTLGAYGFYDEWSEFHKQTDTIRSEFIESQKVMIKTEVDRAIDSIDFWRTTIKTEDPSISEEVIQEIIFDRLSQISFGPDDEYFIFVGDYNGVKIFQEEIRIAKTEPAGGFLTYDWSETKSPADATPILSFVRAINEWQLFVGAGANLNVVETVLTAKRNQELGAQITQDYQGEELIILGVLTGSVIFVSDLIREIKVPLSLEFIKASSYGDSTKSSGEVTFDLKIKQSLKGKHILIVEDIVDTGLTVSKLMKFLELEEPKSLKLATLLSKPSNTTHPVQISYEGFEIEDKFVVGYGLDFAGRYRELPYIGIYNED